MERYDNQAFLDLMQRARNLRHEELNFSMLTAEQQETVRSAANKIKICIAMVAFVVVCFVTEAIPLPGVAFCIGLILVFSGIVGRQQIA